MNRQQTAFLNRLAAIKDRYWRWLDQNWERIELYREGAGAVSLHPTYGAASTRFTDVSQLSHSFERYLETPEAIKNAASAVSEIERKNHQDYLTLRLFMMGQDRLEVAQSRAQMGLGGSAWRVRDRKRRIFEYIFSQLPREFVQPLIDMGVLKDDSGEIYNKMPPPPKIATTSELQDLQQQLRILFAPEFIPWMLQNDSGLNNREVFEAAWPAGSEIGSRIRQFGFLLNKYRKGAQLETFEETLNVLRYLPS